MEKRKFTEEFRNEAARLALQGDRTLKEVADSLGIKGWHLTPWIKKYVKEHGNGSVSAGRKQFVDQEKERLRDQRQLEFR